MIAATYWFVSIFKMLLWLLTILFTSFFRLPDPTGRTYGEMDLLFEKGVSLRKFHHMDVDEVEGTITPKSDKK